MTCYNISQAAAICNLFCTHNFIWSSRQLCKPRVTIPVFCDRTRKPSDDSTIGFLASRRKESRGERQPEVQKYCHSPWHSRRFRKLQENYGFSVPRTWLKPWPPCLPVLVTSCFLLPQSFRDLPCVLVAVGDGDTGTMNVVSCVSCWRCRGHRHRPGQWTMARQRGGPSRR